MTPHLFTYTGKKINPLDPAPEDIDIRDIAHGLALMNRFVGQSKEPISVAQHSVYVAYLCAGTPWEAQALLHDASEAYLGDMSRWVKKSPQMQGYRDIEEHVQAAIFRKFGIPVDMQDIVVQADNFMVRHELTTGFLTTITPHRHPDFGPLSRLDRERVRGWKPWPWRFAETEFLRMARELKLYGSGQAVGGKLRRGSPKAGASR